MNTNNEIMRASIISIIWNLALSGIKLIAGVLGHSAAMISDAVHSASDVFSTIIVIIGVRISSKEADAHHPYGHERLESIAAMVLAAILVVTGIGIGYSGFESIRTGAYKEAVTPGILALGAAILSIAVKEGMFHYTMRIAKKEKSTALQADAWHHRSDALSSIGALVGILFARLGFPIMDPIASLVICIFILKAGYDIFKSATDQVVDHSAEPELEQKMRGVILAHEQVKSISLLKTRLFGSRVYLDVEIELDPAITLQEGHAIAEAVHDDIEKHFPEVKHCMVHVNPAGH
ncbi:MAG: cation diffusion facilitator family transporter [Lachnospiraceae bacterium]|nr:cation diffusion facilitator family transporter [Lachnospiraceae bacterium]